MLHPAEQSEAPEIEEVMAFLRVAETGSFTAAGTRLGIPKSTVSRRVARLEDKLGVQLLHRTTRSLALTEAGALYNERAGRALASLDEATLAAREGRETARGHLRLTAPYDVGAGSLADIIAAFTRAYPEVTVEVVLSDRTLDLVAEGLDLGLRGAAALPDSSLVARKLASLKFQLVASPAYVRAHGAPTTPAELAGHELALLRATGGRGKLQLVGKDGASEELSVRAAVSSNGFGFLRSAALAGGYIAILPDIHAAADLRTGRLVRVLPDYTVGDGNVYLVHPAAKVLPAKARVFRDFLQANIELFMHGPECVEAKAQHARATAARSERRPPRSTRPA
ncbi:MAG TPA: LysR family transcriptional regulator [Nannocystis sp.]|jgi:DNA-binding transcriptional LysR family regulator